MLVFPSPHCYSNADTLDRIFAYMGCITDFLNINVPPVALQVLIPLITPAMTSRLATTWLNNFIPHGLDACEEYATLVRSAGDFEQSLLAMHWTQQTILGEWCSKAGENWARQRKIDVLDQLRKIVRGGVLPSATMVASAGAPEYETTPGTQQDWTWDEDWSSQAGASAAPPTTARSNLSTTTIRRKQRPSMTSHAPRTYECTALSSPLRNLLGSLLQEYTHLPNIPLLSSAQPHFRGIITALFTLFRASGAILASTTEETPIRLCNDCAYLAGETGLMALGMGHLGLGDLGSVLEEVSSQMDFCGVYWRERYLVCPSPPSLVHNSAIWILGGLTARLGEFTGGGDCAGSGRRGVCVFFEGG